MKKLTSCALALLLLCGIPRSVLAAQLLVPGGQVVGLEIGEDRVCIAGFDEDLGADARAAGLEIGDEIRSVNGRQIHRAQDVQDILNRSQGYVDVELARGGKTVKLRLFPKSTDQGPKLGVYLRQGIAGIGTVTWYDPENGTFGALGHGVNRGDGSLAQMTWGAVYPAKVTSVRRGQAGKPGQLVGALTDPQSLGTLYENCGRGVFGRGSLENVAEPLPVGAAEDVVCGSATIRCCVAGETVRDYSVEILKIYAGDREMGRNLLLRVTDKALLAATGGIVQGMSGSPIIQNGKLIGAVTHVLVNDPTTGYGIFIENMLDAAA